MEKERKIEIKKDGTYQTIETIETTPEDGFINQKEIHKVNPDNHEEYHKGYSKHVIASTSDPRITRPFAYKMCLIFFLIGIILLVSFQFILGIGFLVTSIICFIDSKKDIDEVEKELLKNPEYDPKDKTVKKEFYKEIWNSFKNIKTKSSKKERNKFLKIAIPIYCIISLIVIVIASTLFDLLAAKFLLGYLTLFGIFFFWIASKF